MEVEGGAWKVGGPSTFALVDIRDPCRVFTRAEAMSLDAPIKPKVRGVFFYPRVSTDPECMSLLLIHSQC